MSTFKCEMSILLQNAAEQVKCKSIVTRIIMPTRQDRPLPVLRTMSKPIKK